MKTRCSQSSISGERLLARPPPHPCIVKSEMMFHENGHGNPGTSVKDRLCSRQPNNFKATFDRESQTLKTQEGLFREDILFPKAN